MSAPVRWIACVGVTCLLVGCSEGGSTSSSTAASSGQEPKVEPSSGRGSPPNGRPDPPTLASAARKRTLAGAASFVRHYVDLLNYASDTGDVRGLASASHRTCGGCSDYIELYKSTYERGGYFKGDWVTQKNIIKQRQGKRIRLIATVNVEAGRSRKNFSARVRTFGKTQYTLIFDAVWISGQWSILRFDGHET